MNNLAIFLLFLFIGFGTVYAYKALQHNPAEKTKQMQTLKDSHFSIENPPSSSLKGNIATFSGEVLWQSRTATEGAKISEPRTLQQGENVITKKTGISFLNFPNLVSMILHHDTKLEIIQTLPSNFVVAQDSGNVQYDKIGNIPIAIRSLDLVVNQTTGTMVMNVVPEDNTISINVASGSAEAAYEDSETKTHVVKIKSGDTFDFDNDTKEAVMK